MATTKKIGTFKGKSNKAKRAVAAPNAANHTAFMGNGGYKPNNTQGVGGMSIPKRAAKKSVKKRGIASAAGKAAEPALKGPALKGSIPFSKLQTSIAPKMSSMPNIGARIPSAAKATQDTSTPMKRKRSMPQRRNHRSMTGEQMLGKGMRKMAS